MLILSRRRGERIVIGDGIEVTVLQTGRDRVQLGFTAPSEVRIHRREVADRDRQQAANRFASEQLAESFGGPGGEERAAYSGETATA